MMTAIRIAESGVLPDALMRMGIRRLLRQRLNDEAALHEPDLAARRKSFAAMLRLSPVTLVPEKANEQHYEVPAAFYELVLGPHLKYSSGFWASDEATFEQSERDMLALTCERAGLIDGQEVLELGCGWGSLTLWMAEHYPASRILAVSNSASQREHITGKARERGLRNLEIVTTDVARLDLAPGRFDRVVSVEMFEHVRNWEALLARVHRWLRPDGALFLHVFAHHRYAYPFERHDTSDWMSEHFFSGGMMPAHTLLEDLDIPFAIVRSDVVNGVHYQRTSEAWLANLDANRAEALAILRTVHGKDAETWLRRWRLFFMACAELFGFSDGKEWFVSHHRLAPVAEVS